MGLTFFIFLNHLWTCVQNIPSLKRKKTTKLYLTFEVYFLRIVKKTDISYLELKKLIAIIAYILMLLFFVCDIKTAR